LKSPDYYNPIFVFFIFYLVVGFLLNLPRRVFLIVLQFSSVEDAVELYLVVAVASSLLAFLTNHQSQINFSLKIKAKNSTLFSA
tara:strand:+ start:410 stop:661 length:252 start_codon:yes stop_codon:yes gene_type:complete